MIVTARRVLIQAGHVSPREPGFEAGTGTAGEQALVSAVQSALGKLLAADGRFDVTLCPGNIPDGWTGDLFLSLHADGAANPAASGFSFGYPPDSTVGEKLADTFAAIYEKIPGAPRRRIDNYTSDLDGYYGWRRTNAPAKLLIEHGFLTNPGERVWLTENVAAIARAHYTAILCHYNLFPVDRNRQRRAALRAWILKRRSEGWGWKRLKKTTNWREFRRRGGH